MGKRIEKDSLGEIEVAYEALWGAGTERAIAAFASSAFPMPKPIIIALTTIKRAAAKTNAELGELDEKLAAAIISACDEIIAGEQDDQFPLGWLQSGSGTNTNMNANEVIANRASEIAGGRRGEKSPVHPNDHVNRGQSSNDVMPTALHLAVIEKSTHSLVPALENLRRSLQAKGDKFDGIVKTGRTHLMDAAPVRLGQVFGGWAARVGFSIDTISRAVEGLYELPLGGTAVGAGLNAHPQFAKTTIEKLSDEFGLPLVEAQNHFEVQAASDRLVGASAALRTIAITLSTIADNVRLLASGPAGGIGELKLPELLPGSSIMPGKVNPVIPETVVLAAARVIGLDHSCANCGLAARFELNTMMPLMAVSLIESVDLLSDAARLFEEKCISQIEPDAERIAALLERNAMLVTALVPEIGYDKAAEIAKKAAAEGKTIREVAEALTDLGPRLDALLEPFSMTTK